jgi:hypothetical protein
MIRRCLIFRNSRGFALAIALICIIVMGLIAAAVLAMARRAGVASRAESRRVQAYWLAEAGVERAAARLAIDPDYRGEAWPIAAEALGGLDAALVRIEVTPTGGRPDRRAVRVEADYPADPTRRARRIRDITIDLGRLSGPKEPT